MKKTLCILLSAILLVPMCGCSKKPRVDYDSFEKYALSDLKLEKKAREEISSNAFYNMDNTIDNTDETQLKQDHYAQVFSQAEGSTAGNLYVIYYDYQQESDARSFFDKLASEEKTMVENSDTDHVIDSADNHLIVLTQQNGMLFTFECLYVEKDVLIFAAIVIGAEDLTKVNQDWLKMVDTFFGDLRIKKPFDLSQEIRNLLR
ncbi:MAG: hypothetical protein J6T40_09690 [Clostridiales bacterium]|nr:hypothetical protein [Clostridiales bacterium]